MRERREKGDKRVVQESSRVFFFLLSCSRFPHKSPSSPPSRRRRRRQRRLAPPSTDIDTPSHSLTSRETKKERERERADQLSKHNGPRHARGEGEREREREMKHRNRWRRNARRRRTMALGDRDSSLTFFNWTPPPPTHSLFRVPPSPSGAPRGPRRTRAPTREAPAPLETTEARRRCSSSRSVSVCSPSSLSIFSSSFTFLIVARRLPRSAPLSFPAERVAAPARRARRGEMGEWTKVERVVRKAHSSFCFSHFPFARSRSLFQPPLFFFSLSTSTSTSLSSSSLLFFSYSHFNDSSQEAIPPGGRRPPRDPQVPALDGAADQEAAVREAGEEESFCCFSTFAVFLFFFLSSSTKCARPPPPSLPLSLTFLSLLSPSQTNKQLNRRERSPTAWLRSPSGGRPRRCWPCRR